MRKKSVCEAEAHTPPAACLADGDGEQHGQTGESARGWIRVVSNANQPPHPSRQAPVKAWSAQHVDDACPSVQVRSPPRASVVFSPPSLLSASANLQPSAAGTGSVSPAPWQMALRLVVSRGIIKNICDVQKNRSSPFPAANARSLTPPACHPQSSHSCASGYRSARPRSHPSRPPPRTHLETCPAASAGPGYRAPQSCVPRSPAPQSR